MIAWLQNVYEKASSTPAAMPAATDAVTSEHRSVSRPTAAAGGEPMPRLDPAAPRGADPEPHLPRQQLRPLAVAVDRDRHARRSGSTRKTAIHVEMARRPVDFHRRARRRRRLEQRVEIDV